MFYQKETTPKVKFDFDTIKVGFESMVHMEILDDGRLKVVENKFQSLEVIGMFMLTAFMM